MVSCEFELRGVGCLKDYQQINYPIAVSAEGAAIRHFDISTSERDRGENSLVNLRFEIDAAVSCEAQLRLMTAVRSKIF
jgi:hypothetical protein